MFLGGRGRNFLICLHCCDWCRSFFLIHYRPFPVARLRMPFEEGQMEICRPLQAVGTFGDLGKTKHRHVSEHIGIHELQGPTRHGEIWNCCQKGLRGNGPRTSKRARKTPGDHRMFGHVMPPWDDSRSIEICCSGTALCFNML